MRPPSIGITRAKGPAARIPKVWPGQNLYESIASCVSAVYIADATIGGEPDYEISSFADAKSGGNFSRGVSARATLDVNGCAQSQQFGTYNHSSVFSSTNAVDMNMGTGTSFSVAFRCKTGTAYWRGNNPNGDQHNLFAYVAPTTVTVRGRRKPGINPEVTFIGSFVHGQDTSTEANWVINITASGSTSFAFTVYRNAVNIGGFSGAKTNQYTWPANTPIVFNIMCDNFYGFPIPNLSAQAWFSTTLSGGQISSLEP